MSRRVITNLALGLAGACVFLGSAFAAKNCFQDTMVLRGIEANGNISSAKELAREGTCQICVNVKRMKVRGECEGTVANESGENQKYRNPPELNIGGGIHKTLYKVTSEGSAKLIFKGQAS